MVNVEKMDDLTLLDLCNYADDVAVIMNEVELKELNYALADYVEHGDIMKVQAVANLNSKISEFLKTIKEDWKHGIKQY